MLLFAALTLPGWLTGGAQQALPDRIKIVGDGGSQTCSLTVAIDQSVVVGQGTYGVVVKASLVSEGAEEKDLVAKRARSDDLSKKYLAIEAGANELVRARLEVSRGTSDEHEDSPIARYLGEASGYLVWENAGSRTLDEYLSEGACGVESLAAALKLEQVCGAESCVIDDEGMCSISDPEFARSDGANLVVAAEVLARLVEGLKMLHGTKVAHRDVKPANVLVDALSGRLTLCDLGSAVDVSGETQLGVDMRRSPVSPRHCAPERFIDPVVWREFDAYSAGLIALRCLLTPALRSDNDLDAFNKEFTQAGYNLDIWLVRKLTETALSNKLMAPLRVIRDDAEAKALWRILAINLLRESPTDRKTPTDIANEARLLAERIKLREGRTAESEDEEAEETTAEPPLPYLEQQQEEEEVTRLTMEAPMGLRLEEGAEGAIIVTEVLEGSRAELLGAPALGDKLIAASFSSRDTGEETRFDFNGDLEATLGALAQCKGLFDLEIVGQQRQSTTECSELHAAGAARTRGAARAFCEDAVTIADLGSNDTMALEGYFHPAAEEKDKVQSCLWLKKKTAPPLLALVCDGHGGSHVSSAASTRLPALLAETGIAYTNPKLALVRSWRRCAEELAADPRPGGAVAAAALVSDETIVALHCGDARIVATSGGGGVAWATVDHKLSDARERGALARRGGELEGGRVLAGAASTEAGESRNKWLVSVPRALGGSIWRRAGIAPTPQVTLRSTKGIGEVVIASDGLWDVLTSEEVAWFVRARRLFRNDSPDQTARELIAKAQRRGSTDDISVSCLFFDN